MSFSFSRSATAGEDARPTRILSTRTRRSSRPRTRSPSGSSRRGAELRAARSRGALQHPDTAHILGGAVDRSQRGRGRDRQPTTRCSATRTCSSATARRCRRTWASTPSLTITALSERAMSRVPAKAGAVPWTSDRQRPDRREDGQWGTRGTRRSGEPPRAGRGSRSLPGTPRLTRCRSPARCGCRPPLTGWPRARAPTSRGSAPCVWSAMVSSSKRREDLGGAGRRSGAAGLSRHAGCGWRRSCGPPAARRPSSHSGSSRDRGTTQRRGELADRRIGLGEIAERRLHEAAGLLEIDARERAQRHRRVFDERAARGPRAPPRGRGIAPGSCGGSRRPRHGSCRRLRAHGRFDDVRQHERSGIGR